METAQPHSFSLAQGIAPPPAQADIEQMLSSRRIALTDPAEAVEFFYQQGWTDGLPVVPPTPQKVSEFLEYAGKLPGDILGTIPARNRVITAEKVAINAVMAGCLPNYMPVIVAAVLVGIDD